jgi:hypothetical protein
VEGLRISDPFKLGSKTRRVLHWRWERQAQVSCEKACHGVA